MDVEEAVEHLKFEIDNKMIRRTIFTNQAIEVVLKEIENLREKTEKYYVLIYKIREKIKELEEEAEICRKEGCENTEDFDNCCVEILKELLEED